MSTTRSQSNTGADPPWGFFRSISTRTLYRPAWSKHFGPSDVKVITAADAGLMKKSDDMHLAYATEHGCVLYTFNVSDFYRLHTEWISGGREHAGMILGQQQRFSVGEQLRRILRIRATASAESMKKRVEFLTNWD